MPDLVYSPTPHEHEDMLSKAMARKGFPEAYEQLAVEYTLVREILRARLRAGMTQQDVADAIGTTKSAVSRIESVHERMPSVATLLKYADAVDCELEIRFIPRDSKPASRVVAEPRKSKPRPDSKV